MLRYFCVTNIVIVACTLSLFSCTPNSYEVVVSRDVLTEDGIMNNGYPAPVATDTQQETSVPSPTLVEIRPGVFSAPTLTPAPLFTPLPTPTRRFGATPTAVPLLLPPDNPAGMIRYTTLSEPPYHGVSHFASHMNSEGFADQAPVLIDVPSQIDSDLHQVYPSPNGDYTIFLQTVVNGGIPYIQNERTGEVKILYEENYGGGRFFGWHPDGQHFLFWLEYVGLWLVDAATGEIITLSLPQSVVQGANIAHDGQTIAYIDRNWPETLGALWSVTIAGSDAVPLVDVGQLGFMHLEGWSPNGEKLFYRGNCPGSDEGTFFTTPLCIYDWETKTSQLFRLPFTVSIYPALWSPDGHYILTVGLTEGHQPCDARQREKEPISCLFVAQTVYVYEIDTGEATALADGISPVWSPDGSMVAFISDRSGMPEVWVAQRDGTGLQQITNDSLFKSPYDHLSWMSEVKSND